VTRPDENKMLLIVGEEVENDRFHDFENKFLGLSPVVGTYIRTTIGDTLMLL
jgi:hypothetical protein